MNYDFYGLKLLQLEPSLAAELLAWTSTVDLDSKPSYFIKGRHPGFISGTMSLAEVPPVLNQALTVIGQFIPKEALAGYTINYIAPGGKVLEHSDASGGAKFSGSMINAFHIVHIVLQGSDVSYMFRRDKRLEMESKTFDVGGCYLYNNYAYHATHNYGADARINIMLQYEDKDWAIKNQLYKAFGIGFQGY